jgi:hypothetical protein
MGADREKVSETGMSNSTLSGKSRHGGWLLAILLLAYFLLKFQAWNYMRSIRQLEKELDSLRPELSSVALQEHLQSNREEYLKLFEQIGRKKVPAGAMFKHFSHTLPPSITLRQCVLFSPSEFSLSGDFYPGAREPEEALITWLSPFSDTMQIKIRSIGPLPDNSGRWRFEIEVRNA